MQRSILEADQEQDESEESSDMTDEELNMLLARSDEEVTIFRELDVQREVEAERRWRERGNVGPRPPPLMAVEELPEIYQRDEPFVPKEDEEVKLEGRGQRKRNTVNYNDGIDDPFLAVSQGQLLAVSMLTFPKEELGAEEDFDEPPTRKRGRPSKIGSGSGTNTPQPDPRKCAM